MAWQQLFVAMVLFVVLVSDVPPRAAAAAAAGSRCKCLPSDSCWPDASVWEAFNSSIGGQLLASKPPAFPCHSPNFDKAACATVTKKWTDAFWRADQVGAMQDSFFEQEGDAGCFLGSKKTAVCYQGRVPVYAVDVSAASQVQAAVKFASKYNLRVVIKNTGHDYLGRSSAAGSLSIWMHNLQDIVFDDSFVPQGCSSDSDSARSGVTIGAGVVWDRLYTAVHEHGMTIAGAQCSSVGAGGGYVQGAGHSQMSPTFGLSADNVLEMQVVTANGELVVANACQNKDLFWALRGGGGGTFGVVTSVTHATHPPLTSLVFASYVVTGTSDLETFFTEVAKAAPALSDAGWGGFLLVGNGVLIVNFLLPNRNVSFAASSFQAVLDAAKQLPGVSMTGGMQTFSSYYDWHRATQCSATGCSFPTGEGQLLTTRLIPRTAFVENPAQVASTLMKIKQEGYQRVFVYFTAGGKVATPPPEGNAVNPAWRKALWHIIVARLFDSNATMSSRKEMESEITASGRLLRDMSSGSGSYLNEADYNEPQWQSCFFGDNYERLRSIKKVVDPDGLFVCRNCVGSEDWTGDDLNCHV